MVYNLGMQVSIARPNLSSEFVDRVHRAKSKGVSVDIVNNEDSISLTATASKRVIGRFSFLIDDENCILEKKHIIEREFYPFEASIDHLIKNLKRKKKKVIKYILWNL
jgi:hypothetical protein